MMEEELSPPGTRTSTYLTYDMLGGGRRARTAARPAPGDPESPRAITKKIRGAAAMGARARAPERLEDVKATRARVREPRGGASEGEVSSLPFLLFFEMPGSRRSNRSNRSGRRLLATGHRSSGCVSVLVLLRRSVVK